MNCNKLCFTQFESGLPFYIKNPESQCNCTLIKCPNYDICKNEVPEVELSCFNNQCISCYMKLGYNHSFTKKSNIHETCELCLQKNILYKLINCEHYLCGNCINKLYYTNYGKLEDYPIRPKMPFPYEEKCKKCIEIMCTCENYDENGNHEYFDNKDNTKWLNDEKIQAWEKIQDIYEEELKEFCKNYVKIPRYNNITNYCLLCNK